MKELDENFLFGGIDAKDESLNVFDKQEQNSDGLYRPKLSDAKDKKLGYRATLRFLPNLIQSEDGKITMGPGAVEKHVHYVNFKNEPQLAGYYDCNRNFEDKCDMCTMYWKLKNSKNQSDVEKAENINRTTKYYSYIMIIEDEQHLELVGKILVFPYGFTIKEKINGERNGDVSGKPCNVFDLAKGKDFKLIIKDKAGFQNYDASQFQEVSPIKIYDEVKGKFATAPVDEEGKINNPKVQAKIKDTLLKRTVDLKNHAPVRWTEEVKSKVAQVLSIVSGEDFMIAEQKSNTARRDTTVDMSVDTPITKTEATTADDFFSLDTDD